MGPVECGLETETNLNEGKREKVLFLPLLSWGLRFTRPTCVWEELVLCLMQTLSREYLFRQLWKNLFW